MKSYPEKCERFRASFFDKAFYNYFIVLAYALTASSAQHSFLQKWRTLSKEPYPFEKIVGFSTPRPYVYRVLMPVLVNEMFKIEPIRRLASSSRFTERGASFYDRSSKVREWNSELQTKYIISGFLSFAFMIVALYSLRGMTQTLYPSCRLLADVGPVLFGVMLPLSFRGDSGFIYDSSELGLLSLGLYLLLANRLSLFIAVLPFMIINKESNIIILLFSAVILFFQCPRSKATLHLLIQSIVGLSPFFLIKWHFADHPGGSVEFQLWDNLWFWSKPKTYLTFITTSVFFIPFPNLSNVLLLPLIAWLAFSNWYKKPALLRTLFVAAVLINVPLFLLFSYQDEFRNLSLMFPIYYLLACHTLLRFYPRGEAGQTQPNSLTS
jgi:hypothetical protein